MKKLIVLLIMFHNLCHLLHDQIHDDQMVKLLKLSGSRNGMHVSGYEESQFFIVILVVCLYSRKENK